MEKIENDMILSGSMNCEDEFEYRVDREYKDCYTSNIKKLVYEEKINKRK